MTKLLVVDDDTLILESFRFAFPASDYDVLTANSAAEAIEQFEEQAPDIVLCDIRLPDQSGIEVYHLLREVDARTPFIFMTGFGSANTAIEAMQQGAFEYLLKPLNLERLISVVESAAEASRLMRVTPLLPEDELDYEGDNLPLLGASSAMQDIYRAIGRVSGKDVNVLIRGESGTGKEVVAQAIYQHSQRAHEIFHVINCAAIPDQLIESELFGHEKGAFTGADRKRIGRFEQCTRGTLFLDELGDMPLGMQAKILRVLQDQTFERVGGNETIQTDVRIIAATNRNLEEMVEAKTFRADLFYRLNNFSIILPPLREREDDIELLADVFCRRFAKELKKGPLRLTEESRKLLKVYPWPGNVRELQSTIRLAILNATGNSLIPAFFPESIQDVQHTTEPEETPPVSTKQIAQSSDKAAVDVSTSGEASFPIWEKFVRDRLAEGSEEIYAEAIHWMEREIIPRVLSHTKGNQVQTAHLLGITRSTLRRKLKDLGLAVESIVSQQEIADGKRSAS